MSILLYCVTKKEPPDPGIGVAGLPVLWADYEELAVLFSTSTSPQTWTAVPLKESARQFHSVLHRVFESLPIIPFRFPTLMEDEQELRNHLQQKAGDYLSQLINFRESVQMDISISYSEAGAGERASSGSEYLLARQRRLQNLETIAEELKKSAGVTSRDWRAGSASNSLRLSALLDRGSMAAFKEKLQSFSVPSGAVVRVTGPWPVAAFLELDQE